VPLKDDLQQSIEEWSAKDPQLPLLIRAFELNDGLIAELSATRDRLGLTQREVARRMGTSQAAIDRFEDGDVDPRLSTVQRFAASLGKVVKWDVVEAVQASWQMPGETVVAPICATQVAPSAFGVSLYDSFLTSSSVQYLAACPGSNTPQLPAIQQVTILENSLTAWLGKGNESAMATCCGVIASPGLSTQRSPSVDTSQLPNSNTVAQDFPSEAKSHDSSRGGLAYAA